MRRRLLVGTGLSSAIGQDLLRCLADDWEVLAIGRTPFLGMHRHWLRADLRQPFDDWGHSLTNWLMQSPLQVSAFVHLAGVAYSAPCESTTAHEWQSMLSVNLTAAFQLGQCLSPYLEEAAAIVLVGSVDAWHASQDGPAAAYGASKAGLAGLVRHWAQEWGSRGIRVNGVAPGALAVGMGPAEEAVGQAIASRIALGRLGQADEVAAVIAFLLSPGASYISGAWIPVDGGLNVAY
ncbi:MAG: NAD(P)-dependent oxidoreductase [Sulfobacillus acidophilus]|uniref:NAD(P)-dependent oxidoreductase n=1 Tax=Sulfobacillus acidophilus TaxID=53633 RepID=A0A2T2WIJ1_9FIRM|nr:MAG: NAD(P)-dependent oxidoreductase [Sulfobacillus acidophilus]